jgi:TonB-dependent SusC/RagA subfamily outer membrane receptor
MRKAIKYFLLLAFLPCVILAQESTIITGIVTDNNNEPLPGANVTISGQTLGDATDKNGRYSITVPAAESQGQEVDLIIRYIGYKPQTFRIKLSGGSVEQNAVLQPDIFQSEDVVVTGIASRTSKSVAEVSVSRVEASSLTERATYQSLSQLVSGKISGVQMLPATGNIGGGYAFFMRGGGGINGDEQPLIYIDGVRVDNSEILPRYDVGGQGYSALQSLDPENISNIEILKGPAAAAMYGTSASNGVVLITTKSGHVSAGQPVPLSVDYKYAYGYNTQSYKYSASDFLSADVANSIFQDGIIRQHTLNLSGGSGLLRYYASYDDRSEQGIIPNNPFNRKALLANITAFAASNFTTKVNASYTFSDLARPVNDNNIMGFLGNTLLFPVSWQFTDSASVYAIKDRMNMTSFVGSIQFTYSPVDKLEIYANAGVDNYNARTDQTYPQNLPYPTVSNGQRGIENRNNKQFTYDINGRYTYSPIDELSVTSIIGAQLVNRFEYVNFLQTTNFSSDLITDIGGGADVTDYGEFFRNRKEAGIFTEHNLIYQNRYFLTLGLRNDYSSALSKSIPAVLYPKASFAVRLDQFSFFPSEIFSLFKVRAAYGESGQIRQAEDPIPLLWQAISGAYGGGAALVTIGNPDLKPERIREFEAGFEVELLTNYSLEFTYWHQAASQSIVGRSLAPSTGLTASTVPYNVGAVKSSGFESLLQASLLRTPDYGLDVSFIWNYQTNEVTDLGSKDEAIYDGASLNVIKAGLPKHEFYTWKVKGAKFNSDGTYAGVDATDERFSLGNPIPTHTGSFTVSFKFLKNFNLYLLTDWALDKKMCNQTKQFAVKFGNSPAFNTLEAQLGLTDAMPEVTRLTPGTQAYIDAANKYAKSNSNWLANFIEDADYLKIREISLSYSFKDLISSTRAAGHMKDLVVGFSGINLFTTTKYSGADVEVNSVGARDLSRGQDFLTLQHPRTYNMWVRVAF